ncbi:transposase [Streptomyces sp. NBC_00040]
MMTMVERLVPNGLWELFQRVVPAAPVRPQGGGRRRYGDWQVVAAIVFVATTGCTWRQLPPGFGPSGPTAHRPSPSGARPEYGASSIAWSLTCSAHAADWTGRGVPVVVWPEPSAIDDQDERNGLHRKTRALVEWAAERPFAWVDDEVTDTDRAWVAAHHQGHALLHRVDPRCGLTDSAFAALDLWLRKLV